MNVSDFKRGSLGTGQFDKKLRKFGVTLDRFRKRLGDAERRSKGIIADLSKHADDSRQYMASIVHALLADGSANISDLDIRFGRERDTLRSNYTGQVRKEETSFEHGFSREERNLYRDVSEIDKDRSQLRDSADAATDQCENFAELCRNQVLHFIF